MLDAYLKIGKAGAETTEELKKKWTDLLKHMIVEGMIASIVQGAFKDEFEKLEELYKDNKVPTVDELKAVNQRFLDN